MAADREEECSVWINQWIELIDTLQAKLSERVDYEVDRERLKEETAKALGAEEEMDLLYSDLPEAAELIRTLIPAADSGLLRGALQEIRVTESLIPEEVEGRLDEQTIKSKGEIWRIHKYDADPFPSSPHAHNVETGLKVDLGSGELFRKKDMISKMRCKDLKTLRSLVTQDISLPEYSCN